MSSAFELVNSHTFKQTITEDGARVTEFFNFVAPYKIINTGILEPAEAGPVTVSNDVITPDEMANPERFTVLQKRLGSLGGKLPA